MLNRVLRQWSRKEASFFTGLVFSFVLISFFSLPAHAAFNEMLWGARPAGMAGAFTALADDANAPSYNPAGLSFLTRNEFTMMYAQLFTGLELNVGHEETSKLGLGYFSYAPQIKEQRYGSYAISWGNYVASNLYREDTITFTVSEIHQFESLARQPILAYGANIKSLKHSYSADIRTEGSNDSVFGDGRSQSALTADIGLMYRPNMALLPGLKIGFSGQNITEPNVGLAGADHVPAKYTLGIAYQDRSLRMLNPALDIARRNGRTIATLGWEGWMSNDTLAIRAGGNQDGLAGGLGYQFKVSNGMSLRLDYSLLWPLDVENTNGSHRFSLTTNF